MNNQPFDEHIKFSTLLTEVHQDKIGFILKLRHHLDPDKIAIKSAKNPSAQINALCELRNIPELNESIQSILAVSNANLPTYVKAVIELQFLYGLRISEALSINWTHILFNGQIKVSGAKHSDDRIIFPAKYLEYWNHIKKYKISIPQTYDRFYFYRLYKKLGIFKIMGENKNTSVTHSLRYLFILHLLDDGENVESIKNIIGHKSINSTLHYISNLYEK